MDESYVVKDSGKRAQFAGGMVRDTDEGKIHWHRIADGPMMRRYVVHLTKGAVKYPDVRPGVPNWTLAEGPEEYARAKQSAFRHFMQWYYGESDEDHAAATWFNINVAEHAKRNMEAKDVAKVDAAVVSGDPGPLSQTDGQAAEVQVSTRGGVGTTAPYPDSPGVSLVQTGEVAPYGVCGIPNCAICEGRLYGRSESEEAPRGA